MGFAADASREALKRCYGDIHRAINMLESCGGALSSLQQLTQGKWLGLDLYFLKRGGSVILASSRPRIFFLWLVISVIYVSFAWLGLHDFLSISLGLKFYGGNFTNPTSLPPPPLPPPPH